ncbi:MAG: antibiotic biosynthesis monooxygenase [Halieaceae bacterium]|jgi:quinol monooxygenase YgiN|nr:antibiotic biosynthesis monooxygenase [Halieaceae bacterium]
MSINAVVILKTHEDKREGFKEIMRNSKPKLLAADGCISIQMLQDSVDTDTFVLIEEWESQEKHQAYFGELIRSGDWDKMSAHLASEPDSRYCSVF